MPPSQNPDKVLRGDFVAAVVDFNVIAIDIDGSVKVTVAVHPALSENGFEKKKQKKHIVMEVVCTSAF